VVLLLILLIIGAAAGGTYIRGSFFLASDSPPCTWIAILTRTHGCIYIHTYIIQGVTTAAAISCTSGTYFATTFVNLPEIHVPGDAATLDEAVVSILGSGQGGGSIILEDTVATEHSLNSPHDLSGISLCIQGTGQELTTITSAGSEDLHFFGLGTELQLLGLQLYGDNNGGGIGLAESAAALYGVDFRNNTSPHSGAGLALIDASIVHEARCALLDKIKSHLTCVCKSDSC
jgi:hypothetical protein